MTTRNDNALTGNALALEASEPKLAYQTPYLTCNGKLENLTLAYGFGADGTCAPNGSPDPSSPNYDPDCLDP